MLKILGGVADAEMVLLNRNPVYLGIWFKNRTHFELVLLAVVAMGPVVDITKTPMYMAIPMRRKHMRFLISHRPFLNISLNHQRLNDVLLARGFSIY